MNVLKISTAVALTATALSASAANLNILDVLVNGNDGPVTFQASQFEEGFSASSSSENGGTISFQGKWYTNGEALPSSLKVLFLEPYNHQLVSDILTVDWSYVGTVGPFSIAQLTGTFTSDITGDLGSVSDYQGQGFTTYVEDTFGYSFAAPYLTANVKSDIPEPASLALMALGLAGLVASRCGRMPV